jgi:hypothetical protein
MRSNRPKSLPATTAFLLLIATSASADPIRPTAPSIANIRTSATPEVARSGPGGSDPLTLSPEMTGVGRVASPIDGRVEGLAGSSLLISASTPPALDPAELPRESLVGSSSSGMGWERVLHDPEVASQPSKRHNIRIPEPASLTLIAAGLIGLTARNRLRRSAQTRKVVSRRVD